MFQEAVVPSKQDHGKVKRIVQGVIVAMVETHWYDSCRLSMLARTNSVRCAYCKQQTP